MTGLVPVNELSALEQAKQGQLLQALLPGDMDQSYLATDEEDDLAGLKAKSPIVATNYKYGVFLNRTTKQDPKHAPDHIHGIALARTESRVAFPPQQADRRAKFELAGFPVLAKADVEKVKYICQTPNVRKQHPRLNPNLTPEQKKEAESKGVGKACSSCPLAQFYEDSTGKKFSLCNNARNLLWLDEQIGEPVVLSSLSGVSNKIMDDFFVAACKKGKATLSTYAHEIDFGMESEKKDGNEFYKLTARLGRAVSPEELEQYRALRPQLLEMLNSRVEDLAEVLDESAIDDERALASMPNSEMAQLGADGKLDMPF